MSKHTPGDWVVGLHRSYGIQVISLPTRITIAWLGKNTTSSKAGTMSNNYKEDARLIAAAPETAAERDHLKALNAEMMAALKGLGCVCPDGTGYGPSEQGFSEHSAKCQAVSDAIEEEGGEKP